MKYLVDEDLAQSLKEYLQAHNETYLLQQLNELVLSDIFEENALLHAEISKLNREKEGPGLFKTWKDMAIYERNLREDYEKIIQSNGSI